MNRWTHSKTLIPKEAWESDECKVYEAACMTCSIEHLALLTPSEKANELFDAPIMTLLGDKKRLIEYALFQNDHTAKELRTIVKNEEIVDCFGKDIDIKLINEGFNDAAWWLFENKWRMPSPGPVEYSRYFSDYEEKYREKHGWCKEMDYSDCLGRDEFENQYVNFDTYHSFSDTIVESENFDLIERFVKLDLKFTNSHGYIRSSSKHAYHIWDFAAICSRINVLRFIVEHRFVNLPLHNRIEYWEDDDLGYVTRSFFGNSIECLKYALSQVYRPPDDILETVISCHDPECDDNHDLVKYILEEYPQLCDNVESWAVEKCKTYGWDDVLKLINE
jgi:hypothetical protein